MMSPPLGGQQGKIYHQTLWLLMKTGAPIFNGWLAYMLHN